MANNDLIISTLNISAQHLRSVLLCESSESTSQQVQFLHSELFPSVSVPVQEEASYAFSRPYKCLWTTSLQSSLMEHV